MPSQTRFGHHPDPATDFEIEVESLESIVTDKSLGLRTDEPWPVERIAKAMEFRVGGVESCVAAKQTLRKLEEKVSDATKPSQTSSQGSDGEEVGASPADAGRAAGADAPEPVSASRPDGSIPDAGLVPANPWSIEKSVWRDGEFCILDARGLAVAHTVKGWSEDPVHLIAAAPELLEAAFKARHRLLKEGFLPADPTVEALNAAISKALGQHLGGEGL